MSQAKKKLKTTTLRAPDRLLQTLAVTAEKNQRSVNSEMVFRLENSLKAEHIHG